MMPAEPPLLAGKLQAPSMPGRVVARQRLFALRLVTDGTSWSPLYDGVPGSTNAMVVLSRHAVPGEGEIGPRGCAAFLSEPRFEKLPALFEGPGVDGHAPEKVDVDKLKELRRNGLRARRRRR